VIIEIDHKSGFCFGVSNAISKVDEMLKTGGMLFSLGHIVHNDLEVSRLQELGLKTITHDEYFNLTDCQVLIRAHGEPPSVYDYARQSNITLIDATCPVVIKLQQRVKKASEVMMKENGQVVIFGHQEHAEVIGLVGQCLLDPIIIEQPGDYQKIDPSRPVAVFSQTTKSVDDFKRLTQNIQDQQVKGSVETHDTICRQVSNRVSHLSNFASRFDVVIFVGGHQSSNAKVLFDVCSKRNSRTFFISTPEELDAEWFKQTETVGICGATSTPQWLMEQIAERIKQF
jgi:4-hydroxy-3-methylbut-2-enyl diphosphate reductase